MLCELRIFESHPIAFRQTIYKSRLHTGYYNGSRVLFDLHFSRDKYYIIIIEAQKLRNCSAQSKEVCVNVCRRPLHPPISQDSYLLFLLSAHGRVITNKRKGKNIPKKKKKKMNKQRDKTKSIKYKAKESLKYASTTL
jgi:hypothetical protein